VTYVGIMAGIVVPTGWGGGVKGFWLDFELLAGLEEALHTNILRSWSLIIRKRQYGEFPSIYGLGRDQRLLIRLY